MNRSTLLGVAVAALTASAAAPAAAADFNCRASVVRLAPVLPEGLVSEPIRANALTTPCSSQSSTTVAPTTVGPLTAAAANAFTQRTPEGAGAAAVVADAKIVLGGVTVDAKGLQATSSTTCQGAPIADSRFVELVINGTVVALPGNNEPFVLDLGPLGAVSVNEEIRDGNSVLRRALRVTTPLAEVVVAEVITGRDGDPCAPTTPTGTGTNTNTNTNTNTGANGNGGVGGSSGSGNASANPCPNGATYDSGRNLCVIREGGNTIVVGRPFAGPSGGTVMSLAEARKLSNSKCLYVRGPAFAVLGTNGRDSITGGNGTDRIVLRGGRDRAEGGRGDDCIDGGPGSDTLSGALGKDRLIGGSGLDHLAGGSQADRLEAGPGNDTINSGFGQDRVSGGPGNDRINAATAGRASASLKCGSGRDKIRVNRNERGKARRGSCERIYVIR